MDVAKYIGLFLLKNNFVYIHGLGNLELRKRPASHSGDALHPPTYEVTLSTGGSIDDNLANFVANNEQISISKASNALRDFSTEAKAALKEGKEVEIPAIGKFVEVKGKVGFKTNPHFQYTPPSLPSIKVAQRQVEPTFGSDFGQQAQRPMVTQSQPYQPTQQTHQAPPPEQEEVYEEQTKSSINWPRVIIAVGVLILLAVGGYFLISKMATSKKQAKDIVLPPGPVEEETTTPAAMPQDSTIAGTISGEMLNFDVMLHRYLKSDREKAYRRRDQLRKLGHAEVDVEQAADSAWYILLPIANISSADTARLMDSLKVINPDRRILTVARYY